MNSVDDSTTPYIVVGTTIAFEYDNDRQPIGRLILFSYRDNQLTILSEKQVNDAPHQIFPFQGNLLVAIGNSVRNVVFLVKKYYIHIKCLDSTI